MDFNFLNKKGGDKMEGKGKSKKPESNFSKTMTGAVLVFMLIVALYLVFSGENKTASEISISDLAKSVQAGDVKDIIVEGDKLAITYVNGDLKTSKKEIGSTLSQTLFNYGVNNASLLKTNIQVKDESGFIYLLINSLPFLFPIVFVLFFFWYLSRQVKGAGMQAFTFGHRSE